MFDPTSDERHPLSETEEAEWEAQRSRETEPLPSTYPGAIANRIDGNQGDGAENLIHIATVELPVGKLFLTKEPGTGWAISLEISTKSDLDIAQARQLIAGLSHAVDRAQMFTALDEITGGER